MKLAILDDEQFFVDKIMQLLKQKFPDHMIKGFRCASDLLACDECFDILFLDIEMPDIVGIEFAKKHLSKFPYVIYITSHSEYVFDAFDRNVVGFIPKDKIEEKLIEKVMSVEDEILKEKYITLKTTEGTLNYKVDDILYFEFDDGCVYLNTVTKRCRLTVPSLHKLSKQLGEPYFLINRNNMINIYHIQQLMKQEHEILLSNGLLQKVSERNWRPLLKMYNQLVNRL